MIWNIIVGIALLLCSLSVSAEDTLTQGDVSSPWVKHEWPDSDFPTIYDRSIHYDRFYGGCSIYLWAGNTRMKIEGRDNRWYGKQLVQTVTFIKNADGSVFSYRPLPTETYVGEYDEEQKVSKRRRNGGWKKTHMTLPIVGYDVFATHCMSEVATLPPAALKVFQELYQLIHIK